MSILKTTAITLLATGLLVACAREEQPEGVIPEGYKNAMEKAGGVEDTLQDSLQMRAGEADDSER